MIVQKEVSLSDFDFWGGAKDTVKYLTDDDFDLIESMLISEYPDGMTETEINDMFWFEEDFIANMLGYDDFDQLMDDRESDE